jgi:hypothetical protein
MQKPKDGVKCRVLCIPHVTTVTDSIVLCIMDRFKTVCNSIAHHVVANVVVIRLQGKHLVRSLSKAIPVRV